MSPRRYVVTLDRGDQSLPVGTQLLEVRRFEGWDHHGCIPSIRSVVAEMLVVDGPRAGDTVEVVLQSGYEYDPPFPFSGPAWLGVAGGDGDVGPMPRGLGTTVGPTRNRAGWKSPDPTSSSSMTPEHSGSRPSTPDRRIGHRPARGAGLARGVARLRRRTWGRHRSGGHPVRNACCGRTASQGRPHLRPHLQPIGWRSDGRLPQPLVQGPKSTGALLLGARHKRRVRSVRRTRRSVTGCALRTSDIRGLVRVVVVMLASSLAGCAAPPPTRSPALLTVRLVESVWHDGADGSTVLSGLIEWQGGPLATLPERAP